MRNVSVFFSDTVREGEGSANLYDRFHCLSEPRSDRKILQALSAYSIPHTAHRHDECSP